jgi:serine/threonine protein kinase
MKEPKSLPKEPDDEQIARQLEAVHKHILKDERGGTPLALDASDPVVRIAPVLSLLEDARRSALAKTPAATVAEDDATGSTDLARAGDPPGGIPAAIADCYFESGMRIGRFLLQERIGQGGFGIVLRATDTQLNRDVALKILRFEASLSEDACRRFAREAKAAAALSHPNIVHVHESGSDRGIQYLVCELVQGKNLASIIHQRISYSPEKATELVAQLADAVEHAHQRGVLHRDLKPSNILIEDGTGKPRITDFGMASLLDEIQDHTQTGAAIGTPAYMSPEQAAGARHEIGPASDVYGLGAILYQLLTGSPPFSGSTVLDTLRRVSESPATPPRVLQSTVPRDLEAVCLKCLEKKPTQRYASAQDLQLDLGKFLKREPVLARKTNSFQQMLRWMQRNRLAAASLGTAAIFLVSALVATSVGWIATRQSLLGEQRAKQELQQRTQELKAAIDKYFVLVDEDPTLGNMPGGQALRTELLQQAMNYYESLAAEPPSANQLTREIAETNFRLGKIAERLSRYREADTYFSAALSAAENHLVSDTDDIEMKTLRAEVLDQMASTQFELGDLERSLAVSDEALEAWQDLVNSENENREYMRGLAHVHAQRGAVLRSQSQFEQVVTQLTMARSLLEQATSDDDQESQLELIKNSGDLANALRSLGKSDEAEQLTTQVMTESNKLTQSYPSFWDAAEVYAISVVQASTFSWMRGDFKSPMEDLASALRTVERLCWLHPDVERYVNIKLELLSRLAACKAKTQDIEGAHALRMASLASSRELLARDPSGVSSRSVLAGELSNYVTFLLEHAKPLDGTMPLLLEAQDLCSHNIENQPDNAEFQLQRAFILELRSQVLVKTDGHFPALKLLNQAVDVILSLSADGPSDPRIAYHAFAIYRHRAESFRELGMYVDELADRKAALPLAPPPMRIDSNLHLALAYLRIEESSAADGVLNSIALEECDIRNCELWLRCLALRWMNASEETRSVIQTDSQLVMQRLAVQSYFATLARFERLLQEPPFNDDKSTDSFSHALVELYRENAALPDSVKK